MKISIELDSQILSIFLKFESLIWSSSSSVLLAREAVRVLVETVLRTAQRVSRISPSTTPAPGTYVVANRYRHSS